MFRGWGEEGVPVVVYVVSLMEHMCVWAAGLMGEPASRREEDQTRREVLPDYKRLV